MHGYGSLSFFSVLWFFVWVLWIFLIIRVLGDVFRSADLTGVGKAGWTLFLVIFPFVGVIVYLVVRGSEMHVRENQHAVANETASRPFLQQTAAPATSTADEILKLASLRDHGLLSEDEYTSAKARVLSPAIPD